MKPNIRKGLTRLAIVLLIPWGLLWGHAYYRAEQDIEHAIWERHVAPDHAARIDMADNPFARIETIAYDSKGQAAEARRRRALWIGVGFPVALAFFGLGALWAWRGFKPEG